MFPFNHFDSENTLQATFNLSPAVSESMTGVREWGRVIKEGLKARDLYVILKTGPASHLLPFLIPIPHLPSLHACTIYLVNIQYDTERQLGMSQIMKPNVLYLKKKGSGRAVGGNDYLKC